MTDDFKPFTLKGDGITNDGKAFQHLVDQTSTSEPFKSAFKFADYEVKIGTINTDSKVTMKEILIEEACQHSEGLDNE